MKRNCTFTPTGEGQNEENYHRDIDVGNITLLNSKKKSIKLGTFPLNIMKPNQYWNKFSCQQLCKCVGLFISSSFLIGDLQPGINQCKNNIGKKNCRTIYSELYWLKNYNKHTYSHQFVPSNRYSTGMGIGQMRHNLLKNITTSIWVFKIIRSTYR